jgi:hypothetical protein
MDPKILDTGQFCQPVRSFSHLVANKAATQPTWMAINSVEMATTTLKNTGLGYHSFILMFDSDTPRILMFFDDRGYKLFFRGLKQGTE